jgi:toluene monooxygenase system protein A
MALLERSEWYDIARSTNWTAKYVTDAELFPDDMTGAKGVPMEKWEVYDEPYKVSYSEYVRIQREKDAGAYLAGRPTHDADAHQQPWFPASGVN